MKKYLVIYSSPAEAMAQMKNITPEQAAEGMKPWMAWKEKCGSSLVEMGAPLAPGQKTGGAGTWAGGTSEVSGYSIVQGENLEEVKALMEGHPHLSWGEGCTVEIHEHIAM